MTASPSSEDVRDGKSRGVPYCLKVIPTFVQPLVTHTHPHTHTVNETENKLTTSINAKRWTSCNMATPPPHQNPWILNDSRVVIVE